MLVKWNRECIRLESPSLISLLLAATAKLLPRSARLTRSTPIRDNRRGQSILSRYACQSGRLRHTDSKTVWFYLFCRDPLVHIGRRTSGEEVERDQKPR